MMTHVILTAEAVFNTPSAPLRFASRQRISDDPDEGNIDHGIYFYGDQATILVNRNHLKIYPEGSYRCYSDPAEGGDMGISRTGWVYPFP